MKEERMPMEHEAPEVEAFLKAEDPDVRLITDYLARDLTREQAAAVEERLVEDEAFFEKVAPYIRDWTMPVSFRKLLAAHPADSPYPAIEASKGRVREAAPPPPRGRPKASRRFARARRSGLAAAASYLIWVGAPAVRSRINVADARGQELVQFAPAPDQMPAAPQGGGPAKAPVERVPRSVRVGRTSLVHLRAGSKFAYESITFGLEQTVGLNGDAVVEVGWLDPWLAISTPAGVVELTHGIFAFHCTGDPNPETLVMVVRGKAMLKGVRGGPDLVLSTGEYGRLAYPAAPERTAGGEGYPTIATFGKSAP
jgi:hypothetical protein